MNGTTTNLRPPSVTGNNRDELSGKLIIKAQLGDDIRKMMIHNEDLTLNGRNSISLEIAMRILSFRINSHDGTYLCWKDLEFR